MIVIIESLKHEKKMLTKCLQKINDRKLQSIICHNTSEILSELQFVQSSVFDKKTVVSHTVSKIPMVNTLIDDLVLTLANAAYEIWPVWYGEQVLVSNSDNYLADNFTSHFLNKQDKYVKRISKRWLKNSILCCLEKKIPLYSSFSSNIHAAQLALAIEPDNLVFIVCLEDLVHRKERLIGFAKAIEWCLQETKASFIVLIPERYQNQKELETILYKSVIAEKKYSNEEIPEKEERKHGIWPFEGRPHPFSPGEQKLSEYLEKDKELAGLFKFNQRVSTIRGNHYFVDLLWQEGFCIIEVDGFTFHSSKSSFKKDRFRDYELIIKGYTVLRLPHDEVMGEIDSSIDRIRDVVNFCRKKT